MPNERRRLTKNKTTTPKPTRRSPKTTGTGEKLGREELLASLTKLKPALRAGGASIIELSHIWFKSTHAFAFDGGLGIRVPLVTDLELGVPGLLLLDLLRTSSLPAVTLDPSDKDLVVRLGRSRSKIGILDLDREVWGFNERNSEGETSRIDLSAELVEAFRSVLMIKPGPEDRVQHHVVAVYAGKTYVDVYSTDSKTIARASVEAKVSIPGGVVFLPRSFVEQIVAQCLAGAELVIAEGYFAAITDDVEIYAVHLDTEGMPDIRKVVKQNYKTHPDDVPLPSGLEASLDRAGILARDSEDPAVDISVSKLGFTLTGRYGSGELDERLKLEEEHPDIEGRVSIPLLRRAILHTDSFSMDAGSVAFYGDSFLYLVATFR